MHQFDVYKHRDRTDLLLLIVQHDLLDQLASRIVVPLIPAKQFGIPAKRLNPNLNISNKKWIMDTANMAGISNKRIGKKITNLEVNRHEIMDAIDFVFAGF